MAVLYRIGNTIALLVVLAVLCSNGAAKDAFMDELEDAMAVQSGDDKYSMPSDEELALYDRNGDGKLNHDEMAKYLKDALERVKQRAEEKNTKQTKKSYNLGKREFGIGLAVLALFIITIAIIISRGRASAGSSDGREVAVDDVRMARLRRLGLQEEPKSPEGKVTQDTASVIQKTNTQVTKQPPISRLAAAKEEEAKNNINPDRNSDAGGGTVIRKRNTQERKPNQGNTIDYDESTKKGANSKQFMSSVGKGLSDTSSDSLTTRRIVVTASAADDQRLPEKITPEKITPEAVKEAVKVKERVPKPKVELSYEDAMKSILTQILDCSLNVSTLTYESRTKTLPLRSSSQPAHLDLKPSDFPQEDHDRIKKIEKLFLKRICLEMEPMKYAMKCRERCSCNLPSDVSGSTNGDVIWRDVTTVVKAICTDTVLKHLTHASTSPAGAEDDLWSDFRNSGHSQGPSLYFLGALSGWSSDGITVSVDFLSELLEEGHGDPHVKDTFLEMVVSAGKYVNSIKRMDDIAMECSRIFKGLEVLIKQPRMIHFLTDALDKEVNKCSSEMGIYFQKKSLFSTFLSLTTIEAKISGQSRASEPFRQLPHFPRLFQSDVERVQSQIQDGIYACQNVVHKVLRRVLSKNQESALAWMSAVVAMNDLRTATLVNDQYEDIVAGDGYMMNLCGVLLQLCEPFFVTKGADKAMDIQTNYPLSEVCRLEYPDERTIAGRHLGEEGDERESKRSFKLSKELRGQFNLKSEVFHITHRALHIGLTNTIHHYNRLLRSYLLLKEMNEGKEREINSDALLTLFVSQWDTVIQGQQFMIMCSEFYITTASWIVKKLDACIVSDQDLSEQEVHERQRKVLSCIPEFYIKDMCTWFHYVVVHNPNVLKGLNVFMFVDCAATLMNNKGCIPGPMVASKIVSALLAFAECCSKKKKEESLLDRASWGSGIEGDLTACVVTCQAVKKKLASALIHTYTSVDVVEGLDVDKEEFDKFSSRAEIVKLLEFLWTDVEHRDSLKSECGKDTFQGFLNAILDSLLYLLNDGLSRVVNVGKLQKSQEDKEKWNELNFDEQQEKTQFLKNEEHVSKSFMKTAANTLEFLATITEEKKVARCFSRPPISQRAASAIIGFLESLCGPKCLDLKVKNMEKYSFHPRELLVKLVTVLLHISQAGQEENESEFMRSIAADPDYSRHNIEQAHRILKREGLLAEDMLRALTSFLVQCEDYRRHELGEPSDASSLPDTGDERDLETPEQNTAPEGEGRGSSCHHDTANQATATSLENTEESYIDVLKDERHGTIELMDYTAFQCFRNQPVCRRSATIRTIMREITQLKDNLPIHPNSSVFVRQDENRLDFIRAMITGPVDTPYSRGCFVFDVYYPATYPNVPPLVKLITTGNGTVRFNPNLYADGKVCLSLLGTWHGGDASEKWDSKKSSLYQVLLSIQGMILIPDPCFNEPGYEGIRGTAEGEALSREYNAGLRLATVRHAMVAQLRKPPSGLEDLICTHFRLQREAVSKQCSDWLQQCSTAEEDRRMRRAVDELKVELDKL